MHQRPPLHPAWYFVAFLALATIARADEWQVMEGCRLIDNRYNDGDSFHVKADGEERIFRLYWNSPCGPALRHGSPAGYRAADVGKTL